MTFCTVQLPLNSNIFNLSFKKLYLPKQISWIANATFGQESGEQRLEEILSRWILCCAAFGMPDQVFLYNVKY